MQTNRPDIFISATTADLGRARSVVKEALLSLGVHPIEQTNFPPDYRTIKEMLRGKIANCDAVIHLIGKVYGAEPKQRTEWDVRRSYTQLEYDVARELGKPLYTFIAGDDFPYDSVPEEDGERQRLHEAHREAAMRSDRVRYSFSRMEELDKQVRGLQTHLEKIEKTLKRDRRHFAWMAGATLLLLLVIGWLVIAIPHRLKPKHEYVVESQSPTVLVLKPPTTTHEFVDVLVRNRSKEILVNGTPVSIQSRQQVRMSDNANLPPSDWVEIEVVAGPDKGKHGWTLAKSVKRIQ